MFLYVQYPVLYLRVLDMYSLENQEEPTRADSPTASRMGRNCHQNHIPRWLFHQIQ